MPKSASQADVLPKPCLELQTALGDNCSPDGLAGRDLHKLRNRAFGAMKQHLNKHNPEAIAGFDSLDNDAQRREWLCNFMLDPKSGGFTAQNWGERKKRGTQKARKIWLTECELASPKYLNSAALAAAAIQDMNDRLHELPSLKALGIKQYEYIMHDQTVEKIVEEGARVEQQCDMKADHYAEVSIAVVAMGLVIAMAMAKGVVSARGLGHGHGLVRGQVPGATATAMARGHGHGHGHSHRHGHDAMASAMAAASGHGRCPCGHLLLDLTPGPMGRFAS